MFEQYVLRKRINQNLLPSVRQWYCPTSFSLDIEKKRKDRKKEGNSSDEIIFQSIPANFLPVELHYLSNLPLSLFHTFFKEFESNAFVYVKLCVVLVENKY